MLIINFQFRSQPWNYPCVSWEEFFMKFLLILCKTLNSYCSFVVHGLFANWCCTGTLSWMLQKNTIPNIPCYLLNILVIKVSKLRQYLVKEHTSLRMHVIAYWYRITGYLCILCNAYEISTLQYQNNRWKNYRYITSLKAASERYANLKYLVFFQRMHGWIPWRKLQLLLSIPRIWKEMQTDMPLWHCHLCPYNRLQHR